jgi:hypothetical protein
LTRILQAAEIWNIQTIADHAYPPAASLLFQGPFRSNRRDGKAGCPCFLSPLYGRVRKGKLILDLGTKIC